MAASGRSTCDAVLDARRKEFKKSVTKEESRFSRTQTTISIRKKKQEEMRAKRRRQASAAPSGAEGGSVAAGGFQHEERPVTSGKIPVEIADGHLGVYREHILGNDAQLQLEAAYCVRKLLSRESRPPTDAFLQMGILSRVVELMKFTSNARMQFECAWILTNIASSEHTAMVVGAGAVPVLVTLLKSPNVDVREQCIWCLGNVAGDGPKLRDAVLKTEASVANIILNIQHTPKPSVQRNAVWALSNLARFKPAPDVRAITPAARTFAHLVMTSTDQEVLVDSCWGLQYVTDADPSMVSLVTQAGVVPRLVELLTSGGKAVSTPVIRAIGNIVGGDDKTTDAALASGVLEPLCQALKSASRNHRREAAWALSNVAAGTKDQISRLVCTPGLLEQLLDTMMTDDQLVQNEACWAICNVAASGRPMDLLRLQQAGAVRPLCLMLTRRQSKVLHIAVGGLSAILQMGKDREAAGQEPAFDDFYAEFEEAQGVEAMEELQDLNDADLVRKVEKFADDFLDVEGDDEDGDGLGGEENSGATAMGTGSGGQAFSFGITSGMGISMGMGSGAASKPAPNAAPSGGTGWGDSFGAASKPSASIAPPLEASTSAGGGWGDFSGSAWS